MSRRGKERSSEPKVVFINTQYVETDARSFKTVVQQLTGKNATVAADPSESSAARNYNDDKNNNNNNTTTQFYGGGGGTDQFDTFLKEMPPVDELYKLWSDN